MKHELQGAMYEMIMMHQGLYVAAVIDEKGVRKKRTEWQEGWNACHMDIRDKFYEFDKWLNELPEQSRTQLEELIISGAIALYTKKDKTIHLITNCNDEFIWGCADEEEVLMEELDEFYKMWKVDKSNSHSSNSMLWVCKKRKMKPQKPIVDDMKKAGTWTAEWEALPDNEFDNAIPDECKAEIKVK